MVEFRGGTAANGKVFWLSEGDSVSEAGPASPEPEAEVGTPVEMAVAKVLDSFSTI
jgi:hypothetical protein